ISLSRVASAGTSRRRPVGDEALREQPQGARLHDHRGGPPASAGRNQQLGAILPLDAQNSPSRRRLLPGTHMLGRRIAAFRRTATGRRATAELDEELQFHLTQEIEANIASGLSPQAARRKAFRDLGGLQQTREAVGDVRALWLDGLWRDARHAIRALRA